MTDLLVLRSTNVQKVSTPDKIFCKTRCNEVKLKNREFELSVEYLQKVKVEI